MRILITGGSGVIGYNLGCHLQNLGHEIHSVDIYEIENTKLTNFHYVDITRLNSLLSLTHKIKPNQIIHLAEIASIEPTLHVEAIHVNLGATAEFLYTCATLNIRGIIGTWMTLEEHDLLTFSLNRRATLLNFFKKGNCVINQVIIPQILHPDLPSSNFRNLIGRLWNHIECGQPFFIDEPSEHDVINGIAYCTLEQIYHTFDDQLNRNTREPCCVDYIILSLETLVGFTLDIFDREEVTLVGRNEPRVYKRIRLNDHPIRQWIYKAWDIANKERNNS